MKLLVSSVLVLVLLGLMQACQPPDCDRPDCGTCGNACCTLELMYMGQTSQAVYNAYIDSLKMGGADGRYTFKGGEDLRQFKLKADFIAQGWHRTLTHHYNDTLDFTFSTSGSDCMVRAFSISQIAGAYCDSGQNYKNLKGFISNLTMMYQEKLISGCPRNMTVV